MYQFLCLRTPAFCSFLHIPILHPNTIAQRSNGMFRSHYAFLICYIKAASKFKKNAPVTSFFHELDETFTETEKFQNDLTQTEYRILTDEILCRKYFCTTEEIYNTFSKNDFQKEALRHCIFHLTENINRNFAKQPPQKLFRCSGCFKRIYSVKYFQGKII